MADRDRFLEGSILIKCADELNVLQIKYRARAEMWETQIRLPYNKGGVQFLMYSSVLSYNYLRPPNALP